MCDISLTQKSTKFKTFPFFNMKEYQFIYKKSFAQVLSDIIYSANLTFDKKTRTGVNKITVDIMNKAEIHFGHPYFNTATIASIYRTILKRVPKEYDVQFPIKTDDGDIPVSPWWMLS